MLDKIFPKIHNEGYKFIVIFVLITIVLYFISGFLGFIGLVLTIWCYYFFRDPERISIGDENYLTSPADGLVLQVLETEGPRELGLEDRKFKKVSIFMNVFDCHVIEHRVQEKFLRYYISQENLLMHHWINQVKTMKEIIIT